MSNKTKHVNSSINYKPDILQNNLIYYYYYYYYYYYFTERLY